MKSIIEQPLLTAKLNKYKGYKCYDVFDVMNEEIAEITPNGVCFSVVVPYMSNEFFTSLVELRKECLKQFNF